MKKLDNKIAIITGAGSGMGRSMALLFAEQGAKLILADLSQKRLEEVQLEIAQSGGTVEVVQTDVSKKEEVENMINKAMTAFGRLDVLINNAGIMDNFQPVGELEFVTYEKVMRTNVEGPLHAMKLAIPIFLKQGSGVIINNASVGGLRGGVAGAAYTASKHALIGLTKNTGYVYAKSGIRCNAIAPGAVSTHIGETIDYSKMSDLVKERIMPGMELIPRTGEPMEIARAALFLASDDSSFVNGHVLVCDGGWTAG